MLDATNNQYNLGTTMQFTDRFIVSGGLQARHKFQEMLHRLKLQVLYQWDQDVVHLFTAVLQLKYTTSLTLIKTAKGSFYYMNVKRASAKLVIIDKYRFIKDKIGECEKISTS